MLSFTAVVVVNVSRLLLFYFLVKLFLVVFVFSNQIVTIVSVLQVDDYYYEFTCCFSNFCRKFFTFCVVVVDDVLKINFFQLLFQMTKKPPFKKELT